MPPKVDTTLWATFTIYPKQSSELSNFVRCKYCDKEKATINASRIRSYLNKCRVYIDYSSIALDNIVVNIKRKNLQRS